MRFFSLIALIFLVLLNARIAAADELQLNGVPAVLPSGLIMLEGHDISLWGIESLATDQQCWHDERAWDCGEQGYLTLRHHLANHTLRCVIKSAPGQNKEIGQCFRLGPNGESDVAGYLVKLGWARDNTLISGGAYSEAESRARAKHKGMWTSRFQSAEDWKNGVQKYIEYTAPAIPPPSGDSDDNTQE